MESKRVDKEEFVKNKDNSKTPIIVLIIMIILLLGTIGYIVIDKTNILNKKEEVTEKKVKKEIKVMSKNEAKELLEKYYLYNNEPFIDYEVNRTYKEGMTSDRMGLIALKNIETDKIEERPCSDFYNEYQLEEDTYYKTDGGACFKDSKTLVYQYNDVNKVHKSLFGTDILNKGFQGSYLPNLWYIDYNSRLDIFIGNNCNACGMTSGPNLGVNEIKEVKEDKNKLTIDVYYQYEYASSMDQTQNDFYRYQFNGFYVEGNNPKALVNMIKEKYIDKLDLYEVTFEKVNKNYIFKELIKINT